MVDSKDIPDELIDPLLATYKKTEDILGKNGILKYLTKRVVKRALQAEMAHHLGHEKHGKIGNVTGNTRNGTSKKTLRGRLAPSLLPFLKIARAVLSLSCILHHVLV